MAQESYRQFRFVVKPDDEGLRLDQALAAHVPDLSRRQARLLLDLGGVFLDGTRTKVAGRLVRPGQEIVANIGGGLRRATGSGAEGSRANADAPLATYQVVHEDAHLLIVDKPSGVLTAPTPEGDRGTLAYALGKAFGPVFVVHRLDLETSGLLVFARTADANRVLSERFRVHDIDRVYLAALRGELPFEGRAIDEPVGDRRALTHVDVLERLPGATLVSCRLETGRTHQIRIHARHVGHPVLGDRRYGEASPVDPPRLALHATRLGFRHPATGETVLFERPWPEDLAGWLDGLRARVASAPGPGDV